jgi:hypothetical protein
MRGRNMPNKDKVKQREVQRQFYARHKEQQKKLVKERKKKIKNWFREYKKIFRCSRCNETDSVCIDFHHLDPDTKKDAVAMLVRRGASQGTIKEEISKCIPLCLNCHRKEHYEKRRDCPNSNRDYDAPNVV